MFRVEGLGFRVGGLEFGVIPEDQMEGRRNMPWKLALVRGS